MDYTIQGLVFRKMESAPIAGLQKKELKVKGGVRVDASTEAAARAGIQDGDVILALANTETPSVQVLEALVAKVDRAKPVSLLIRRGEWAQYVVIRPAR
jgi:serine protease Do